MIIDARSLNLNSLIPNNQRSSDTSQSKTEELVRNLDKSEVGLYVRQDTLESIFSRNAARTDVYSAASADNIAGKIRLVRIEEAFEKDYTAEDALNGCWFSSTRNSILNLHTTTSKVADDAVVGMEKEEFLAYVRENGLDKEIIWSGVEAAFRGGAECYTFSDYSDYAGALYASLEDRILKDFSDEEQAQQLERLNSYFNNRLDSIAEQYFMEAKETFDKLGIELPEEELKESLRSIMLNKRDAYRDYVKENSDYAGLEGSEDKWLERDAWYMANALRNAYKPENIDSGKYSEDDMIMVSLMGEMYRYGTGSVGFVSYKDEESIGLAIAMNWLTMQSSFDSFELSDDIKETGKAAFAKYAQNFVDGINAAFEHMRSVTMKYKPEQYAPLDTDAIKAVVDVMVKTYQESKDAEKAIYATTAFAYGKFTDKQGDSKHSGLVRYSDESRSVQFWNDLYDNGKDTSFIGKLFNKWNTYANALSERDIQTLFFNGSTRVYHSYRTPVIFETPLVGGYDNGRYWGFNLEEYVFGNK